MSNKNFKSRSLEIEVPTKAPFQNDKLNRAKLSDILTDIVSFYGQSGCVMALNGEWGSGKTTFVRMWRQELNNKGYKTLYFNTWSSDYTNDPLSAMVSELSELSPNSDTIIKIAAGAARIGISALKGILKKTTGIDSEDIEAAVAESAEIGKEYIKEYSEQKATIDEFKKNVQKYVADNAVDHPVVFFVDELDRCNPHYAVLVLERIKHLFDIPNIIFVLAINKAELGNAIQGYFGSAKINSDEYLRRFIDIEYMLPEPSMEEYCEHIFNEYDFSGFFHGNRLIYFGGDDEANSFKTIAINLFKSSHSNLRQIDRIYAYTRLALMQFKEKTYLMPDIFFLLCYWKIMNYQFYDKIKNKEFSIQQLLSELENALPTNLLKGDTSHYENRQIYYTIASLLYCYDITNPNGYTERPSLKGVKTNPDNKNDYNLNSRYLRKDEFSEALDFYYTRYSEKHSNGLNFLFQRIDLLNSFNV